MGRWRDYLETRAGAEHSVVGDLRVLQGIEGPPKGRARDVLVLLPPSYSTSSRRYPVVYMHDGQNLFDRVTSFAGEWEVDESAVKLADEGVEAIFVGIPNAGVQRVDEYSPFVDDRFGGGGADAYLQFLAETVRPLVDAEFRTAAGRENTGTVGSSMGGLISLYAFFRHPEVFGFAGALSPSLGYARGAMLEHVRAQEWVRGRIYLDCGTREGAPRARDPLALRPTSSPYVALVRRFHAMLEEKGYGPADLRLVVEAGAVHDEKAWARRFPAALKFLLSAEKASPRKEAVEARRTT